MTQINYQIQSPDVTRLFINAPVPTLVPDISNTDRWREVRNLTELQNRKRLLPNELKVMVPYKIHLQGGPVDYVWVFPNMEENKLVTLADKLSQSSKVSHGAMIFLVEPPIVVDKVFTWLHLISDKAVGYMRMGIGVQGFEEILNDETN